jgi:hypothetical protein
MSNKNHSPSRYFTLAIILIVATLAASNWYFRPDAAWEWIRAMLILPALWGFMTLCKWWALRIRAPRPDDEAVLRYSNAVERFFLLAVAAVGFIQTISLGFKLAAFLGSTSGPELTGRIKILGIGIVSILLGNAIPKILTPQSLLPGGGAFRIATARRFLGWTWVLLGFSMVLISLSLPFELVKQAGKWMTIAGTLAVPAAIVWMNLQPRRRQTRG